MPSLRERLGLKRRSKKVPDQPTGHGSPAEPSSNQTTSNDDNSLLQDTSFAQGTSISEDASFPERTSLPQESSPLQEASPPKETSPPQETLLPRIRLDSFLGHKASQNDGVTKRRDELRKALEEIEGVLQAHSQKASTRSPAVKACIEDAGKDVSSHDIANALQDDRQTRGRTASSKAGRFMQKLFPISKMALGLTGALVSNAGYPPVQIATNALIQVFELAMNIPKQSEEVLQGLQSLYVDEHLLGELNKLPVEVLDEMIIIGALELQTQLIKFLHKSLLWMDKGFFSKYKNGLIEPTQMADAKAELQRSQQLLTRALGSETYLTTKWQQVVTVQAELLDDLCPREYHGTHILKQKELHSSRLENSNEWAVTDEKFVKWRDERNRMLWCPGLPGAGKTFMLSRMIDELEIFARHQDFGLAYVFCQYNRSKQQSEKTIIEAMIRQLVARKPELCFELKAMLENPIATINDRKTLLKTVLGRFKGSFLMIDALDEYSADYVERNSLCFLFKQIVQDCQDCSVGCCITSREADGIWQMMSSSGVSCHRMEVRSNEKDIVLLIEKRYDEASVAIEWLKGNQELRDIATTKVLEKSGCIFKLAELQIRSALRKQSAGAMKAALKNLTTDVNHYYNESMQRIAGQVDTGDIVFNLLKWVTYARSPIHVNDLKLALSVESDESLDSDFEDLFVDVSRYIGLSEGLVSLRISKATNDMYHYAREDNRYNASKAKGPEVELAHESIRDYFRTNQAWIPRDGDVMILNTCLTAMASPIFINHLRDIWQEVLTRIHWQYQAKKTFSVKSGEASVTIPEFVFWALSCWGQHLKADHLTAGVIDLMSRIHQVCQGQTDKWMQERGVLYSFEIPPSSGAGDEVERRRRPARREVDVERERRRRGFDEVSAKSSPKECLNADISESPPRSIDSMRDTSSEGGKSQNRRISIAESARASSSAGRESRRRSPSIADSSRAPSIEGEQTRSRSPSIASLRLISSSISEDLSTSHRYALLYELMLRSGSGPKAGPLYWCAYYGWLEGCRFFLLLETDPNLLYYVSVDRGITRDYLESVLSAAVASGNPELVQLFLNDSRIDPEYGKLHYVEGHVTPLMQACENDDAAIVKLLLAHENINVNAYYRGGYGVGLSPILRGRPNTISLLLRREDLDVNKVRLGRRPIHHLVNLGGCEAELNLLLQHPNIDINARTDGRYVQNVKYLDGREQEAFKNERTALMVASVIGHANETAILLKDARIDAGLCDSRGMTPLMLVATGHTRPSIVDWGPKSGVLKLQNSVQRHAETLEALLLSTSGNINAQDKQGRTAAAFAAMCGSDPRAPVENEELLSIGRDPRFRYEAISRGISSDKNHFVGIMKLLLGTPDVEVDLPDDAGHAPLDYANFTEGLVIQERDFQVKHLKDAIERLKPELEPTTSLSEMVAEFEASLEDIRRIQDLLIAAGAQGGKPIPVPPIPVDRTSIGYMLRRRKDFSG